MRLSHNRCCSGGVLAAEVSLSTGSAMRHRRYSCKRDVLRQHLYGAPAENGQAGRAVKALPYQRVYATAESHR